MSKRDVLYIKTDLGLCVDILTAIFFCAFVNKTLGMVWFAVSLIMDLTLHIKECIEIKRGSHGSIK